jgi:hypothetical protein
LASYFDVAVRRDGLAQAGGVRGQVQDVRIAAVRGHRVGLRQRRRGQRRRTRGRKGAAHEVAPAGEHRAHAGPIQKVLRRRDQPTHWRPRRIVAHAQILVFAH